MSTKFQSDAVTHAAANDICAFVLLAFEPQWLRWNKTWNLTLAEMAWNAGNPAEHPASIHHTFPDPEMDALLQRLLDERRATYADREFNVFELDATFVDDELAFTFLLSWDGGETTRPCQMIIDGFRRSDVPQLWTPPPGAPAVDELGQVHSIVIPRSGASIWPSP